MKRSALAALALALVVAIAGCSCKPATTGNGGGGGGGVPVADGVEFVAMAAPATGDPEAAPSVPLADAINGFGFDLARRVTDKAPNTVVSPLSLAAVLAMTYDGARGDTAAEMAKVLRLSGMSVDQSDAAWADLIAALAASRDTTLAIANSLWTQSGAPFESPFIDGNRDHFGADVKDVDFMDKDGSKKAINDWVKAHTGGRIPEIIDSIPEGAVLYLVNAVFFEADWALPFEKESTGDEEFTLADGKKVSVRMMNQDARWAYAEDASWQAVRLPYKGERFAAYVIVPRAGETAETMLAAMDAAKWRAITGALTGREGIVAMPKLELEWGKGVDLGKTLAAMGMPLAFDQAGADFSGMSQEMADNGYLYIAQVLHRTYLRVDEKGTEAAAASAVGMVGDTAMPPAEQPFELRADHPYIFAIADEPSGTLLFLGLIGDPTQ